MAPGFFCSNIHHFVFDASITYSIQSFHTVGRLGRIDSVPHLQQPKSTRVSAGRCISPKQELVSLVLNLEAKYVGHLVENSRLATDLTRTLLAGCGPYSFGRVLGIAMEHLVAIAPARGCQR